jgi:hypothetical protein
MNDIAPGRLLPAPANAEVCHRHIIRARREMINGFTLISNYTNHLAQTPLDPFMKGAEWSASGKLKPAA